MSQRWQARPVAHERVRCRAGLWAVCVLMRAPRTIRRATASVRRAPRGRMRSTAPPRGAGRTARASARAARAPATAPRGSPRLSSSRAGQHAFLEVLDAVEQAHHVAHGAVHLEALEILGHLLDRLLAPLREFQSQVLGVVALARLAVGGRRRVGLARLRCRREPRLGVLPHLREVAVAAQHGRVAPVERALRAGRVEDRQPHRVGAVALDELVRVDDVAEVLAHLAPVADHHLVEQAAGERLAVREELERPDVAQRLGDGPLVEDEVAAVRAGHEPLRRAASGAGRGARRSPRASPRAPRRARTPAPTARARRSGSRACPSRGAPAPPHAGQVVFTNSSRSASGLPVPVGRRSSGSTTGSCSRGTGTVPQLSQ